MIKNIKKSENVKLLQFECTYEGIAELVEFLSECTQRSFNNDVIFAFNNDKNLYAFIEDAGEFINVGDYVTNEYDNHTEYPYTIYKKDVFEGLSYEFIS